MTLRRSFDLLLLVLIAFSLSACTIFRDRDPVVDNGNGEPDPRVVDILIVVDLPRGALNIMPGYARYMSTVQVAMAAQNITTRRVALAPLYRTQSGKAPLLYGHDDPYTPFHTLEDALLYYVSDEGLSHLDDAAWADGENLAALGMNLDRETIFNPFNSPPETIPYYRESVDGFLVFHLTGSGRNCAHNAVDCALDGQRPADFFTETDDDTGFASWLSLPGPSGLPPSKIMHIAIATEEGTDYDSFASRCLREPNFPANLLDLVEPSSHDYFGAFTAQVRQNGGYAQIVDFCTAFSMRMETSAISAAAQVGQMLR